MHLALGTVTLLVNLWAFRLEYRNVTWNAATLDEVLREVDRVRNDLLRQLADAYERYENGRQLLALYRTEILPDLVRAFRGV